MNAMRTAVAPARQANGLKNALFLLTVAGLGEGLDRDTNTDERFVDLVGRLALTDDWRSRRRCLCYGRRRCCTP